VLNLVKFSNLVAPCEGWLRATPHLFFTGNGFQ
jgi:hypothetical protein